MCVLLLSSSLYPRTWRRVGALGVAFQLFCHVRLRNSHAHAPVEALGIGRSYDFRQNGDTGTSSVCDGALPWYVVRSLLLLKPVLKVEYEHDVTFFSDDGVYFHREIVHSGVEQIKLQQ